jgi:hypothetical protein
LKVEICSITGFQSACSVFDVGQQLRRRHRDRCSWRCPRSVWWPASRSARRRSSLTFRRSARAFRAAPSARRSRRARGIAGQGFVMVGVSAGSAGAWRSDGEQLELAAIGSSRRGRGSPSMMTRTRPPMTSLSTRRRADS